MDAQFHRLRRNQSCETACREVHRLLDSLPLYRSPNEVPFQDGLYFFFEEGEWSRHGPNGRIVRVGNHPHSQGGLIRRLRNHYSGQKNGSVFRKFLGGALLRRRNHQSSCLQPHPGQGHWECQNAKTCSRCKPIEQRVSALLRSRFSFRCVAIPNRPTRNRLEAKLIATLAQCDDCKNCTPSRRWLGRFAYSEKVHRSRMWNDCHIDNRTINRADLRRFSQLVKRTRATRSARPTAGPLVIIACGKRKIWNKDKKAGPTRAGEAYIGTPFKVNRDYARRVGSRWMILSAKYGYIDPDFVLPGPYNVTFKEPKTQPVSLEKLQQQAKSKGLARFKTVVGLGGREYREAIQATFEVLGVSLSFPTQGLRVGKAMRRLKRAQAWSSD